jgi:hypothetical protein
MLPFIKGLAMHALDTVIQDEPAFAADVLNYLKETAGPELESWLENQQNKLESAPQQPQQVPGNVVPLPETPPPGASNGSPAASKSEPDGSTPSPTPPPSAPPVDAAVTPRRGGSGA